MQVNLKRAFLCLLGLTAFAFNESFAGVNPLIGSWKWDNAKTLANFQLPPAGSSEELIKSAIKAKTFVEGVNRELQSNVVLTYRESECEQVMYDHAGHDVATRTWPYRIVKVRKGVVVVDEFKNGGVGKLFLVGSDSFYVKVKVGAFTYKDYYTKQED